MLNTMIRKWSNFVVNHRLLVIMISFLLAFGALYPIIKNASFDNSNELFFLPGDPNLKKYDRLLELYGDNEYLLIGIEAREQDKNVFNYDTLQTIAKITEFMEDHGTVTKVASLTKYQYVHSEDDTLTVDDLIEDIEELENSEAAMAQIQAIMEQETLVHGVLVTEDFQHTVIVARTEYIKRENDHKVKLIDDFNAYLAEQKFDEQGFKIHVFGQALLSERFFHVTQEDQSRIIPMLSIIIFAALFFSFRTLAGMFLPWMVIISSLLMTMGVQFLFDWPFNVINTSLINILIMIGIGDSVHMIVEFYHFRHKGFEPKEAAKKAIEMMWLPCFYTSLTTAIGFAALSVTQLVPVREFGVLGATGAVLAFVLSLTLLPAVLSMVQTIPARTKRALNDGMIPRLTEKIAPFTYKYRAPLSMVGGALILLSIGFASQLSVDANFMTYFKESSKVRQDFNYFDKQFGGGLNVEFMFDSGKEGGVKDPVFLAKVLKFQDYLESLPETGQANSILDYIRKQNQSMHNDDPEYFKIPETRELVAQFLLLYENTGPEEDLTDLKTLDEQHMRVSIRVINMSDIRMSKWMADVSQTLEREYPDLKVQLTGTIALFNAQQVYMQEGMIQSFSTAVILISLCFFVLFRSFKYGLLAMIPSIFPILFAGAIMYLMGLALDLGTMLIAAMTIGTAVDDSIHVMNRYVQSQRTGKSQMESIHLAMTESGRAVIFTSFVLILGFSTFISATFVSFIYLGMFSAIIMFVALIADLFFLPAIIFYTSKQEEIEYSSELATSESAA